jgi:AcrR family transcriptional regulator
MDENILPLEPVARRNRRREDDIRQLILEAARQEFTRLGYAGATTRAIAQLADVSESLVFRYFGSKAALFDLVVFGPFNELMARFNETHSVAEDAPTHIANSRDFVRNLLQYLRANRMLIAGFLQNFASRFEENGSPPASGFENYFALSQASVDRLHRSTTGYADPSIWLAVRLGFATVLGSVLFSSWLFAEKEPDIEVLTDGLVRLLVRVLEPEPGPHTYRLTDF